MVDELKSIEIRPKVHDLSMIKQVIESRSQTLEIVREALSNMCTPEVRASEAHVQFYLDPDYGGTFVFRDDGCGMAYSGDEQKPERLDRFLNLGYSGVAGIEADKYGWKGLGSKLMYNCRKLAITTWTGDNDELVYMVEVHEPRSRLLQDVPEWPRAYLAKRRPEPTDKRGTSIRVYGFEGGKADFSLEEMERYMLWNTIAGVTREEPLPRIVLKVANREKEITTGYRYIQPPDPSDPEAWKTVVVDPPIQVTENTPDGQAATVLLKGGFTLNTADACGSGISLSRFRKNTGIRLSVLGIPYFRLSFYEAKGEKFQQYQDLCSFVVECDDLATKLNIDRSGYNADDQVVKAVLRATRRAFSTLAESEPYKRFQQMRRREEERTKSKFLNKRKDELNAPDQEIVCVEEPDGEITVLHRVPDNEHDTLALFWKLEGRGLLPFEAFTSLEHTAKNGIDVIANYQITEDSQLHLMEAVEFEHCYENFLAHGHNPRQTSLIVCWEIQKPEKLHQVDDWLYRTTIEDQIISVVYMRAFPGLSLRKRSRLGR